MSAPIEYLTLICEIDLLRNLLSKVSGNTGDPMIVDDKKSLPELETIRDSLLALTSGLVTYSMCSRNVSLVDTGTIFLLEENLTPLVVSKSTRALIDEFIPSVYCEDIPNTTEG